MTVDLTKVSALAKLDPTLFFELLDDAALHPTVAADISAVEAGTMKFSAFVTAHKDVLKTALVQAAQELVSHPALVDALLGALEAGIGAA